MNTNKIKADFPILSRKINDKSLVYLDNAATTQKPKQVIRAISDYYEQHNANVHRGIHKLSEESTGLFEEARKTVVGFMGAKPNELVWVRNTTEAINLVAQSWARQNLKTGDVIIASELEHHSNLIPWQVVAKETGAGLTFVDVTPDGQVDLEHLEMMLEAMKNEVKLVALSALSNTTGAELDVERVVKMVRKYAKNAKILLDGAQWVGRKKTEFDRWGVDFWAFSGHKMYGPMGIGGLVVKREVLEETEPWLTGGGMIEEVELTSATYTPIPERWDAGAPDVAGAVGLARACVYLDGLGMEKVEEHERELTRYAVGRLKEIPEIEMVGPVGEITKYQAPITKQIQNSNNQNFKPNRLGSVAFLYMGVHAHDVAQILDNEGVAVRSGHHCTMPLHTKMGWAATTRASFGVYNTKSDVDRLVEGLEKVNKVFR